MHDLLEGVRRYGMAHVLYKLIVEENLFSVEQLNSRLKTFNYTKNGFSNKPALFVLDHVKNRKLHMSANEMLTLILIFSMLIKELTDIDCNNRTWLYFITLQEIVVLCFSKKTTLEMYEVLDSKISLHHELYID